MRRVKLGDMKGGWFIGDFEPTCLRTGGFEAACKTYTAGQSEDRHYHLVATEFTLVASGSVSMNGTIFGAGDVIIIDPGEAVTFTAVEDSITMVVKVPSVAGDKYLVCC